MTHPGAAAMHNAVIDAAIDRLRRVEYGTPEWLEIAEQEVKRLTDYWREHGTLDVDLDPPMLGIAATIAIMMAFYDAECREAVKRRREGHA